MISDLSGVAKAEKDVLYFLRKNLFYCIIIAFFVGILCNVLTKDEICDTI